MNFSIRSFITVDIAQIIDKNEDMYTATITHVEKIFLQSYNSDRIVVTFELVPSPESNLEKVERKLDFSIDTSEEAIRSEVSDYKDNFNSEYESALANKAQDEANKKADQTISSLEGSTL